MDKKVEPPVTAALVPLATSEMVLAVDAARSVTTGYRPTGSARRQV